MLYPHFNKGGEAGGGSDYVKLDNISVTSKMVKKVTITLIWQRHLVLNCEPEISYILAELCNNCLKESCFPNCWKVSSVFPVFKNVDERSTAEKYGPVSLLSVVSSH